MAYNDILVFLDGSLDNEARLEFAIALATTHKGRLTGLDVSSAAAFESEWSERARSLNETFDKRLTASGLESRFRIADRTASGWKDFYAHYSDIVISTQPNAEASGKILPGVPEEVLMSSGTPMIVLPHLNRPDMNIEKVVIAWSPSANATRALHDALPILAQAREVTVFAFDPPSDERDADLGLVSDHLTAHGIRAGREEWPDTGDISAIEALFASRAMEEADLVVAGAYSHSPFRERLFGGMTRDLLQQFSVPVFISH